MDHADVRMVIVAEEADVVLVCDTVELHVSSAILTAASPVFRAMFSKHFSEGQALRSNSDRSAGDLKCLPTVKLPDDPGDAMEGLCHALHHQSLGLSTFTKLSTSSLSNVLPLAIAADKYQCTAAVSMAMAPLCDCVDFDDSRSEAEKNDFVEALYLLNDAKYFQKYTGILVRRNEWDFTAEGTSGSKGEGNGRGLYTHALGKREGEAIDFLLEKVAEVAESITLLLYSNFQPDEALDFGIDRLDDYPSTQHDCECQQRAAGRYLAEFVKRQLWPRSQLFGLTALRFKLFAIESFDIPNLSDLGHCEVGCDCLENLRAGKVNAEIEALKQTARDLWPGLCLDCFKGEGPPPGGCRIPHQKFSMGPRPATEGSSKAPDASGDDSDLSELSDEESEEETEERVLSEEEMRLLAIIQACSRVNVNWEAMVGMCEQSTTG